jgi:hypothetical protein
MRIFWISLIILGTSWSAQAQIAATMLPSPPVTNSEISNYCIFENKTYSPGALTCDVSLKPSHAPQECQPPDATHKRAYWKLLEGKTEACNQ